ncbi:MAG TPA: hypothetical protein VNP04_18935 [Alphaproteobacteria bacterium]|nr:hypothetical protein [Alphaproteobacteria bacterium]
MAVRIRPMTAEEVDTIQRLAPSYTKLGGMAAGTQDLARQPRPTGARYRPGAAAVPSHRPILAEA